MRDLRTEADSNYYFGEIKMWNDSIRNQEVGVIVESKGNSTLFKKFFNSRCVFFPTGGWVKAHQVLQLSNDSSINGVLAIIDADFTRIENEIQETEGLFYTDCHDTEIMMVNSKAWDNIVLFYADVNPTKGQKESKLAIFEQKAKMSLKDHIFGLCKTIGCLRLLNKRAQLDLKFRTFSKGKFKYLNYSKFLDKKTLELDLDEFIKTVESKSEKHSFFEKNEDIYEKFIELLDTPFDTLELSNGHDFTNIFSLALENVVSNKRSGKKVHGIDIEKALTISYRMEDFQNTTLFASLISWHNENQPEYELF